MTYSALLLVCCTQNTASTKERETKPNIIILYADDMGYGDLGVENPKSKIPTPNLDKLSKEGIRFTDGHSSSGICTPSRYALLTGRYHWRDFHGIVTGMGESVFKENQYTMPQMLKENGYKTACIGKWHLGWDWETIRDKSWTQQDSLQLWGRYFPYYPPQAYDWTKPIPDGPLDHGFDYYFGDGTINFPPYVFVENNRTTETPTVTMRTPKNVGSEGPWEARPGPAVKNWDFLNVLPTLTRKAVAYIEKQKKAKKPFFLYMAFPSPHSPIIPNKEFQGKSGAGDYGDYVYQTDWSSGQILKALDAIGATENTIVIFTADNGPERYAYDRILKYGHHSSAPFRGLKRDIYEGGHHVPFVIRWPKKIKAESLSDEVINQVDLLKTFSSIIGAKLPKGLAHDSYDFSEVWSGEKKGNHIRKTTIQNTFEEKYAVRTGDWLYINYKTGYQTPAPEWTEEYFGYQPSKDSVQLFNLKTDIFQKANLALQMPEKIKEMQNQLDQVRQRETFVE